MSRSVALLCGLVLGACVSGTPQADDANASGELRNGAIDTQHKNVLLVRISDPLSVCTGALIGSHTVLTAAHCVFGGPMTVSWPPFEDWIDVVDRAVDPTYEAAAEGAEGASGDLAVLRLGQELTGIEPARLLETAPMQGEVVTMVGYGLSNGGVSDLQRRTGTNTIAEVDPGYFTEKGTNARHAIPDHGDSGGPAFVTRGTQDYLVGAFSRGNGACTTFFGLVDCSEGVHVRVDARLAWIAEQAGTNLYDGENYDPTPLGTGTENP